MAVKKTQIYSSLWAACDKLRGGMDASQYKDYILTLLFMKYVTDKYRGEPFGDFKVFDKEHDPEKDPAKRTGDSFNDFVALKGKKNIGEGMDKIIARMAEANPTLKNVIDNAQFNDEQKMGKGREMVDKLTDLISIFQRPELDFSRNKVEGDDIIGDAYEYLMKNFATQSGKSKGQFYTPAEVSRILAHVVGIQNCTDSEASVCDPACGSGSLLIRAVSAAPVNVSGYGQEKDISTAGLAVMNAALHDKAAIEIKAGNTFSDPQWLDEDDPTQLMKFDYEVMNPPFSMKNWQDGLKDYDRFEGYGAQPPEKNGDYAWLMHVLKTLKPTGKAAIILPLGVLFRGNAEATIRQNIIDRGWIKGIINLPKNLFYGTPISACIMVIDKENATNRTGIYMIDAQHGYVKDGNKNRLREEDVYKICRYFDEERQDNPKYARLVPYEEIKEKNGYNLSISRYIDSSLPPDLQDIDGHLNGGIPERDLEALSAYWTLFPSLQKELFRPFRNGYAELQISEDQIGTLIQSNGECKDYQAQLRAAFTAWKRNATPILTSISHTTDSKKVIRHLADDILQVFTPYTLLDPYDVYEVLLGYWIDILSDDVFLIALDEKGYLAGRETENITELVKSGKNKGKEKVVGWDGKLIPKTMVQHAFFLKQEKELEALSNAQGEAETALEDFVAENNGEESALSDFIKEDGKVDDTALKKQLTQWKKEKKTGDEEYIQLSQYQTLKNHMDAARKAVKKAAADLDAETKKRYETLTEDEIKKLLVDGKWYPAIGAGIEELYQAAIEKLTMRISVLAARYAETLPQLSAEAEQAEKLVEKDLERMGFSW